MNAVKFIIALVLALGLLTTGFVGTALADNNQSQDQTATLTCTTGDYGQNNCTINQNQNQTQVISYRPGVQPVTNLADTGLDTAMTAGSVLTVGAGLAAAAFKAKFRV